MAGVTALALVMCTSSHDPGNDPDDPDQPEPPVINTDSITGDVYLDHLDSDVFEEQTPEQDPGAQHPDKPHNTEISYDESFRQDGHHFGTSGTFDLASVCEAFMMSEEEFEDALYAGTVVFYGLDSDGTMHSEYTASDSDGDGHWFDANENVCEYASGKIYVELSSGYDTYIIGKHPSNAKSGESFSVRQAFVYTLDDGSSVTAVIIFNVFVQ